MRTDGTTAVTNMFWLGITGPSGDVPHSVQPEQ